MNLQDTMSLRKLNQIPVARVSLYSWFLRSFPEILNSYRGYKTRGQAARTLYTILSNYDDTARRSHQRIGARSNTPRLPIGKWSVYRAMDVFGRFFLRFDQQAA